MFRREQKGWLGIDIGTASVKIAQLVRSDDVVRVLATSQVNRSAHPPADAEELVRPLWSAKGEIRAAVGIGGGFRGRDAATAIPMGFCDVHQVGNLAVSEADLDQEVRRAIEAITQSSADHLELDIWPADLTNQQRWNVLAVARPWADRIYHDVADNGFACHTIDGVPQALARALSLSAHGEVTSPTVVLDWGFSQATFCLVVEGQPVYVRVLKDCSFGAVLSSVSGELGVTLDEAGLLLEKYGARGLNFKTEDEIVSMIAEMVAEPIRHLESELARTLTHTGFQYRNLTPRKLMLFGGGALMGGLSRHLTRKLRLETHAWSLEKPKPETKRHDALFGVALALSALAWEEG